MGGLPGPYMYFPFSETFDKTLKRAPRKWFLQALGNENLHKMLDGFDDKSAQFVCTIAYSPGPEQEVIIFQERADVNHHYFILSVNFLSS
jgi:inosine/xanthosine triphosphate pyrophosphatase family protein